MASFQVTRDLRSASQDPKRAKERTSKWARGTRPPPGEIADHFVDFNKRAAEPAGPQYAKIRPERAFRDGRSMTSRNIVKPKMSWDLPSGRSRAKVSAMEELDDSTMSRSLLDMLPSAGMIRPQPTATPDRFLYSFDATDTPGKPLSLDIFVKPNTKETEKLVEKEYEIVDSNGDELKGRKARLRNLRRPNQGGVAEPDVVEDDGFELV